MLKSLKNVFLLSFFLVKETVFASSESELCPDGTVKDPSIGCFEAPWGIVDSYSSLSEMLVKGANVLLLFAGSIATIMLVYSGIQYSLAMGDDDKMNTAKRNIKWSLVGLWISLSAFGIVEFVLKKML